MKNYDKVCKFSWLSEITSNGNYVAAIYNQYFKSVPWLYFISVIYACIYKDKL